MTIIDPIGPARRLLLVCAGAALATGVARADPAPFDLAGPSLRVSVGRDGVTLPLSETPNLAAGDRLRIVADLPAGQAARYRMVLAFLRGATNPPSKGWLIDAQTWKPKDATIDAVVPTGAEQAVVLLVPETGGALGAVTAAIRGRPGAFVRVSQVLNQSMLDRARLAAFVDGIRGLGPAELAETSPRLAQSLAVKLDTDCLLRQPDARAACLTQGGDAAVLADGQTSSIAQTLAGAPADVAMQLSSTPQAGLGYYSPYIGVIRDVARILGAFQSAQLQFIPALSVQHGGSTALLLNAVPSFRKPQSVLVAALPGIAPAAPPPLVAKDDAALCATQPAPVLRVAGAPLVFATAYARNMALRLRTKAGATIDLPVEAQAAKGGYVVDSAGLAGKTLDPAMEGVLHGSWGFGTFDGPRFRLVAPAGRTWQVVDGGSLVVGRETPLLLSGSAAACVADVSIGDGDGHRPVAWTAQGEDHLALKVPLTDAQPGPVTIAVQSHGVEAPQRIVLRAYAEAGRIAGFVIHAGDRAGVLEGTRLDQVARLELGGVAFEPGSLDRVAGTDRLAMSTDSAAVGALHVGDVRVARVVRRDGRAVEVKITIAPPRPQVVLIGTTVARSGAPAPVPTTLQGAELMPQDGRLTFSLKGEGATRFSASDTVELMAATTGQTVTLPLHLQDAGVAIGELDAQAAFGGSAYGPIRFRVVQADVAGDWQPLTTLVRIPRLEALTCPAAGGACVLKGAGLYLVREIRTSSSGAAAGDPPTQVPDGFTGSTIAVPRAPGGRLFLTLRDAPDAIVVIGGPRPAS